MVHLVTYDLVAPNDRDEDYDRVIGAIKAAFPNWCHIEKSVWLINTGLNVSAVRQRLKPYLHSDDVLFVARLTGSWASRNLGEARTSWIKKKTF